jgi:hypothetical protein
MSRLPTALLLVGERAQKNAAESRSPARGFRQPVAAIADQENL